MSKSITVKIPTDLQPAFIRWAKENHLNLRIIGKQKQKLESIPAYRKPLVLSEFEYH
ncbi:MAG: hypothetical protein V3U75_11345 [Methylococcaceae bacterium]